MYSLIFRQMYCNDPFYLLLHFPISISCYLDCTSTSYIFISVCGWFTGLSRDNRTSRLEQQSEDELVRDFQWIFNTTPYQGPAEAIIHWPWIRFFKRPMLLVDGRWRLPHKVIIHDLENHSRFLGWLGWQTFKRNVQNTSGEIRKTNSLTSYNNT